MTTQVRSNDGVSYMFKASNADDCYQWEAALAHAICMTQWCVC